MSKQKPVQPQGFCQDLEKYGMVVSDEIVQEAIKKAIVKEFKKAEARINQIKEDKDETNLLGYNEDHLV